MKYKLINQPNKNFAAVQQILYNRGISIQDIPHYLNLSDQDINSPLLLGEQNLKNGLKLLIHTIEKEQNALIIIDVDCDGYTSAALLINYLYRLFPKWVEQHLNWMMHQGKQHGLTDCIDKISNYYSLVICPDSASNNYEEHKTLFKKGIGVLVLDHHLADSISEYAVIINNQLSNYPNKQFSGVGVTWQFCRYIDNILKVNYANNFLDLVALGNCADMMSLHSFETRYLITKGFKKENIKNPFIDYMIEKNSFPLSKSDYASSNPQSACTSIGAAFFIVPFVNAITRSGTIEQKNLLFNSMLNHKAFQQVLSTKRGHRLGEKQKLVIQAIRTVTNVKNRQTKAEEAGMQLLEKMISANNMLQHKILLFLLQPNQIQPNIRGLVANKIMAKYQRPCLVLTKTLKGTYEGSGRGYTKTGLDSFKKILEQCPQTIYAQGHDNAMGFSIQQQDVNSFIDRIDFLLKDISNQIIYRIDYDFKQNEDNNDKILQIAEMNDFWGQDIDRAYVNINFKITNSNFHIMKSNTLKFNLPNNLCIIKFNGTEQQIEKFSTNGYIQINAICKCCKNQWCGNISPQLILQDYEIVDSSNYYF